MAENEFVLNKEVLKTALAYAEKKHGCSLSNDLARAIIEKFADKKTRMPFEEALRYSLNEFHLFDDSKNTESPKKRTSYRSVAAKYFSMISGLARAARARANKPQPKRRKKPSVTGTPLLEANGQYAFKV